MQPAYQGIDAVYKTKADNKDIRDLLERLVPEAKAQMVEFSKKFKGNTEQETCKKIFDYLKNNFRYVADGEEQIIKLPSALLKKKVGDCKSYSLFTSSILENLGIPYSFIYTSYNSNPIPGHVYVMTENGCIIDAVYGIFNQEKKPIYKYKKNMNVRYMAGMCSDCNTASSTNVGVGNVNTILLAPGRAAVSQLIKWNVDGIASNLQNTGFTKFADKWKQLGGDRTVLTSQIRTGASKPVRKIGFFRYIKRILAKRGIRGIGNVVIPEDVKLLIRAACQKLLSSIPGVGNVSAAALSETIINLLPLMIAALQRVPDATTGEEVGFPPVGDEQTTPPPVTPPVTPPTPTPSGSGMNMKTILPIVALVAAGGIYLATKKK